MSCVSSSTRHLDDTAETPDTALNVEAELPVITKRERDAVSFQKWNNCQRQEEKPGYGSVMAASRMKSCSKMTCKALRVEHAITEKTHTIHMKFLHTKHVIFHVVHVFIFMWFSIWFIHFHSFIFFSHLTIYMILLFIYMIHVIFHNLLLHLNFYTWFIFFMFWLDLNQLDLTQLHLTWLAHTWIK